MAGILIPRRETRQPQVFTGFNPAFPRPGFAFVASLGLYERAAQRLGTKASGDSLRTTAQGIAYKVANATNGGLDFGVCQSITSDAFTIIVLANQVQSASGVSTCFSQRIGTASLQQIDFALNADNVLSNRSGSFALLTVDTASVITHSAYSNSTTAVDGRFHVFGATKAGASSEPILWYDGIIAASTSGGVGSGANGTVIVAGQKVRIGNLADFTTNATLCAACDIPVVLCFNSVLPDAMMRALTETLVAPYKVFQAPAGRVWIPGGVVGVTLSASAGSYSVSGQSAALKGARQIASTAGDYNAIGQVATLEYGRALPAAFGAYSVAGQTAAVVAARNIVSAAGSYGIAGQDAGLTAWRVVSASAGAYSLSGANAALVSVRHLQAGAGTYASAGQSAALLTGLQLGASAGSYDLTGESATFWIARALGLEAGSYAIAGQGAMLVYGTAAQVLAAAPGVFSVSGQIASLAKISKLSLASGTHAVSGSPAALRISRIIAAAAGSYVSIGSAASLSYRAAQAVLVASPGSFSITGQSAAIKVTRRLASGSGSYAVAGQQSALQRTALVNANAGDYSSTGQQVTFAYYRRIAASSGSLLVTGAAADLVRTVVVSAFVHGNRRVFEMSRRKRVVVIPRK